MSFTASPRHDGPIPGRNVRFERHDALDRPASVSAALLNIFNLGRAYTPEVHNDAFQIVLPVRGVHYVNDGKADALVDLNHATVIRPNVATRDKHPSEGDVGCLLITPDEDLLENLWGPATRRERLDRPVGCTTISLPPPLLYRGMIIAAQVNAGCAAQALAVEELAIDLLRLAAIDPIKFAPPRGGRPLRLIDEVKDILASTEEPLSLGEIAALVEASPTYLTDLFRRFEGMPLYRYQLRLRLGRALALLPETEDITDLALDLGFSSHSHFSSTFRSVFGVSPSSFRALTRNDRSGRDAR